MPLHRPAMIQKKIKAFQTHEAANLLLDWFRPEARPMPWRQEMGNANPYHVWLSEIMLQQTTVATVIPYFNRFISRWPTLKDLAEAPLDDVLQQWAGLGYYARARNLKACAEDVVSRFNGHFPTEVSELKSLPGVGDYTAAAIASIAFGKRATVVDGNVERVVARILALKQPMPKAKRVIKEFAEKITPHERAGDYAQALMDLGATICKPRNPVCDECPWSTLCSAKNNEPEGFPVKAAKKIRPIRFACAYWLQCGRDVLLRRRPEKGLLGGMMEIPTSDWVVGENLPSDYHFDAPIKGNWTCVPSEVRHIFSHFELRVRVMKMAVSSRPKSNGEWHPIDQLDQLALPTLMKKIAKHALEN